MTITGIKQQLKNPNRTSIYVDGKYSFSLDLNQLLEQKLKIGLELNDTDIKRLIKLSNEGKLKSRALEWLLIRPHSKKEFSDYLKRKKVEADLIDVWTEEFTQKRYLGDSAFAKWWIENRRLSKNYSNRRLRLELQQKGVSRQIISELLEDTKDDERTALISTIKKKSKLSKYKNDRNKFTSYLIGQGFSYSDIKELLNKQRM